MTARDHKNLYIVFYLFFKLLKIGIVRKMVKELRVAGLSLNKRFAKCYNFSLHFHETAVSK